MKQRLIAAYRRHLTVIQQDHLPTEARGSFAQLMSSLAGVAPLRGEDAVTASVRKMSSQEADECAALIVEIFALLPRASDSASSQRSPAAVVQLRSVDTASAEFDVPALIATN
jgi:hypothetical protein